MSAVHTINGFTKYWSTLWCQENCAAFKGHPPTFVDFRETGIKGLFTQNEFLLLNFSFQKIALTDLPIFLKISCSHMISKHRVNSNQKLASLCPTHSEGQIPWCGDLGVSRHNRRRPVRVVRVKLTPLALRGTLAALLFSVLVSTHAYHAGNPSSNPAQSWSSTL